MRAIGKFLESKKVIRKKDIDSESVFYVFKNIIKLKYGEMGVLNLKPSFYKKGVIFIKTSNSNWSNEIWLNRQMIIDEINKKIGEDEIKEIKFN